MFPICDLISIFHLISVTDWNLNKQEDILSGGRAGPFHRKNNQGGSQWGELRFPKGRAEMT